MRIHLIHGIHTSGSDQPPEALLEYLPENTAYPDYGYELAIGTKILNPMIVGMLTPYLEDGDVLIGHSNGCAIIYDTLRTVAASRLFGIGVVFVNAALERQIVLPPCVSWCDVYYNAGDTITEAAKIAAFLGLVDPVWGEMGHAGYDITGRDSRIANHNCAVTAGLPEVNGHSDIFSSRNLPAWGPEIARRVAARP